MNKQITPKRLFKAKYTNAFFTSEKKVQLDKIQENVFFCSLFAPIHPINSVYTDVFTCQHVACEGAGWAAYSQLRLHVTGEYNRQQAGISSQTSEYVARHPVYTQRVHSYSRSQKLEILSVWRVKCSVYMRQHLAI